MMEEDRTWIPAESIEEMVFYIISYLEDTIHTVGTPIYFRGVEGLAASAVLRAIAQHPPLRTFEKIIHVDCSRWKSRRALQRTIAQELKLPHRVMAIFDRQDEEDDFAGVDETSRAEIQDIGVMINLALREHMSLVIFHNGSDNPIDLNDFGIPKLIIDRWFSSAGCKVLWTFGGRLRLSYKLVEKVHESHIHLRGITRKWMYFLQKEAREIAECTGIPGEVAEQCCLYLLSLDYQSRNIMDFNWAIHASSYWVCDGIIQANQVDEAWELAAALRQQIHIEDYSCNGFLNFRDIFDAPPNRWIFVSGNSVVQGRRNMNTVSVHPESTSFFLTAGTSGSDPPSKPLPNDMFRQSDKLRVLKLCNCSFSFSSPPFRCCRNLRFLGLDGCKDQQSEDKAKQDRPTLELFSSLWVLDICNTDWDLASSPEIIDKMALNIREVHIKKGKFWHRKFAWRQLENLRKLLVIEPTSPWETGEMDEFTHMEKLELLHLSGNSTIQVLPSLSGAIGLKTMVLNGCVGLQHVDGLPPSLESFSLDARTVDASLTQAKVTRISMDGCARLSDFMLRGSLPELEELNLSGTSVKKLNLEDKVVHLPCLKRVMLLGCEQLRAILWPKVGMPQLSLLCVDTRGGEVTSLGPDFMKAKLHFQAYISTMDIRFIQSFVGCYPKFPAGRWFGWNNKYTEGIIARPIERYRYYKTISLNLTISATSRGSGESCKKGKKSRGGRLKIIGPPLAKSLIPNASYNTYIDVSVDIITVDHDYNSALQFQPLGCNVEIGDGISETSVESIQGMQAIIFVMDKAESLHVHDNSSITTVIPEHMMSIERETLKWRHLKRCHLVRCPNMHTVFTTNFDDFYKLEDFWAADLQMAHCIWSQGRKASGWSTYSFAELRSINLYSCPRLTFVLGNSYLPNLEALHIVNCGDLKNVFPVDPELVTTISTEHPKGALEFPKLKHVYLHELYKLQHICEAKMYAPRLEKVRLRGCWGLRRLPAVGMSSRPVVDCEKDWWEKLEWEGLEAGHYPSLFEPRHSSYYKKPLPRVSVLR